MEVQNAVFDPRLEGLILKIIKYALAPKLIYMKIFIMQMQKKNTEDQSIMLFEMQMPENKTKSGVVFGLFN